MAQSRTMRLPEAPDSRSVPEESGTFGRRIPIGKVDVDRCSIAEASEAIRLRAREGQPGKAVHLVNAYTVALADRSADYEACLRGAWLRLPDGRPLQWISASRGPRQRLSQVRGTDLMCSVMADGLDDAVGHFLLGSTEDVLDALERELRGRFPGVSVRGSESPPFSPFPEDYLAAVAARIRQSGANVVWVALGTPKQDYVIAKLAELTGSVCVGVGGAFEMLAGFRRSAPTWVIRLGLEWAFRLVQEPRRLWRRYLFGNLAFIRIVTRDHFRRPQGS